MDSIDSRCSKISEFFFAKPDDLQPVGQLNSAWDFVNMGCSYRVLKKLGNTEVHLYGSNFNNSKRSCIFYTQFPIGQRSVNDYAKRRKQHCQKFPFGLVFAEATPQTRNPCRKSLVWPLMGLETLITAYVKQR